MYNEGVLWESRDMAGEDAGASRASVLKGDMALQGHG